MRKFIVLVLFLSFTMPVSISLAASIPIDYATLTRGIRGQNSIGWGSGDRIFINAELDTTTFNAAGGAANTTMIATNNDSSDLDLYYEDFGGIPMFSKSMEYSADLADPWNLFVKNGTDVVSKTTNTLVGVDSIPFVKNVQLQGGGLQPTVKWTLDGDVINKRVQVFLHDAEGNRFFWENSQPASTFFYTIPEGVLEDGKAYTARIKVFERNDNDRPLTQTETFINFTPLQDGSTDAVFLPVVGEDTNPDDNFGASAYFDVDVSEDIPIFIDPFIAIGYDFQIGAGDPLFESVLLPELGDNQYALYLWSGTAWVFEKDLLGGQQYFFNGGSDYFRILGIEDSLGIDPGDFTAFITQLTFVDSGTFTGSMTPIIRWVDPVEICAGDLGVPDGDVDGSDLVVLVNNPSLIALETFADNFGRTDCMGS